MTNRSTEYPYHNSTIRVNEDVQIFVLRMQPLRGMKWMSDVVAISLIYDDIKGFLEECSTARYKDTSVTPNIMRYFKKDSALEEYRPLNSIALNDVEEGGQGISDAWIPKFIADILFDETDTLVMRPKE